MFNYIIKRILIMIPTLFGITLISFAIVNLAPGGPIEQKIQQIRFGSVGKLGGSNAKGSAVTEEVILALKKQYGFDRPVHIRYWIWLKNISRLDFGESFTYEEPAINVIVSKFPVSLQFGIISLIMTYFVSIFLGVAKALKHGSKFDHITSFFLAVFYSIPDFMLAILLIVYFAGGKFYQWFPVGELYSDGYYSLSVFGKIFDRIHHFVLPLICYMIGSFTILTMLMKNSLLDEIKKDYIRTARAKGLSENTIYLKHALRNALIPIVTGLGGFLGVFFTGALLLESIFQLDGIGLLSYKSILQRDYNVILGILFLESVVVLVGNLISDLAYVAVDPRIDFE